MADKRTTSGFKASTVWLSTEANWGTWLISSTTTVKELVALSAGMPLSVTRTTTRLVLGP